MVADELGMAMVTNRGNLGHSAWSGRTAWVISISLLVASCSTTQRRIEPKEIRPLRYSVVGPGGHISGLRDGLSKANASNRPVRVLTVHGMITDAADYSQKWQRSIADQLGFAAHPTIEHEVVRGYDLTVFVGPQPLQLATPASRLRITRWYDPAVPNVDRLIFYELLWAPLRDAVKNQLLACFEARPPNDARRGCKQTSDAKPNVDSRASINGMIKDQMMIGGFADATIVLSDLGDVLRDDVNLVMCRIATDVIVEQHITMTQSPVDKRCDLAVAVRSATQQQSAASELAKSEFFVITHSLGSFLVMDAQQRAADNPMNSPEDEIRNTLAFYLFDDATVFMFANQISLLELGRLRAVCEPKAGGRTCPNAALRTDLPSEGAAGTSKMTAYVAFNDVNDLLGFELPPYLATLGRFGSLVNVTVRNPGFRNRVIKDPNAAHTRHGDNPAIIQAVVDGIDIPPNAPIANRREH